MSYHAAMRDRGRRMVSGVALSPEPTATHTPGSLSRCRVYMTAPKESMNGSQVTPTGVVIRVPLEQEITAADRWQVTHRQGKRLKEFETYAIIGEPETVLGEKVLHCQRIFGGSAL